MTVKSIFLALAPPSPEFQPASLYGNNFYFSFCHYVNFSIWKPEMSISQAKSPFILNTFINHPPDPQI